MSPQPQTPDEVLMAYALGELSGAERHAVELSIAASPEATSRLARFRAVIEQLHAARASAASFTLSGQQLAALRSLNPGFRPADESPSPTVASTVRQIARLVFDSWGRPAGVGYRGASTERLLRFEFPGGSIDISVAADPAAIGKFWITGEVRGSGLRSVTARSTAGDGQPPAQESAMIADDGYFELPIRSGPCTLEIESQSGPIFVGPIAVGRE